MTLQARALSSAKVVCEEQMSELRNTQWVTRSTPRLRERYVPCTYALPAAARVLAPRASGSSSEAVAALS